MPSPPPVDPDHAPRVRRVLVIADLVESVRLMAADEDHVIFQWRRFVHESRDSLLPHRDGRMVKSLGDGMLIEFASVTNALAAVRAMQALLDELNAPHPRDRQLFLRFGAHVAAVVVDDFDVLGSGVNLAARLATLAGPAELAVSAEFRDELVPGLDGDVMDLGDCYLKHLDAPVRAFRLSARRGERDIAGAPARHADDLRALVAVLPFSATDAGADGNALAAALTDDLVAALSRQAGWAVVSRLSTAALHGRAVDAAATLRTLGADFALSATLRPAATGCAVELRVHETRHGELIESRAWPIGPASGDDAAAWPTSAMAAFAGSVILARQVGFEHCPALPNVPSYALLLRAIALLHRLSIDDMAAARRLLDHLVDRHPRAPEALAWSAKWHFLQLAQVTGHDPMAQLRTSRARLAQGLDARPDHAMSLALEGHLLSFADGETARSEQVLRQAVHHGPNEPLAWMYLSGVLAHTGRGEASVDAIRKAARLAPLDPSGSDLDLFAADAYKVAGDLSTALVHAERSVRQNAIHLSAWVQLIILQMLNGQEAQARASAANYLVLRPAASVQRFLDRHPARGTALAQRDGAALIEAGIPR